jgi:CheY-like chemotaxis protein
LPGWNEEKTGASQAVVIMYRDTIQFSSDIDSSQVLSPKHRKFGALRKVSGQLKKIWSGKDQSLSSESGSPRILVVDDEESICFSMSEYFSLQGYKVDTANEIDEAEKLIEATPYRVVIQDLRLTTARAPEGLEIIKFIRDITPQTRVIVLTAYGSLEMEEEARRCGADAFLRKPKPLSQVAQVVQGLLESPPKQYVKPA